MQLKIQSTIPEAKGQGNGRSCPIFSPSSAESLIYSIPSNGYELTVNPCLFMNIMYDIYLTDFKILAGDTRWLKHVV
jgi:hypothetical protein